MKQIVLAALVVLGMATAAQAQTQTTDDSKLAWDINEGTVEAAQNSIYKVYVDALPAVVLSHTCVAGSPIICTSPVPAMTPGIHVLQVTRSIQVNNEIKESLKSNSLSVELLLLARPANLRVL